jgi:hypothetical protein
VTGRHGGSGRGTRARLAPPFVGLLVTVGVLCVIRGLLVAAPPAPPPSSAVGATPAASTGPAAPSPLPGPSRLSLVASVPVSIAIPSLGVTSKVQQLGLTTAGALAVPVPGPHYDEVGWFRYSPTPGEVGPSVMVGHVDSATTGRSVFWALGTLRRGAQITVDRADGSSATFTVSAVSRYEKSRFPTALVYRNTTFAALRLITCGGPIDATSGHYRDNVVVFASLTRVTAAA